MDIHIESIWAIKTKINDTVITLKFYYSVY